MMLEHLLPVPRQDIKHKGDEQADAEGWPEYFHVSFAALEVPWIDFDGILLPKGDFLVNVRAGNPCSIGEKESAGARASARSAEG